MIQHTSLPRKPPQTLYCKPRLEPAPIQGRYTKKHFDKYFVLLRQFEEKEPWTVYECNALIEGKNLKTGRALSKTGTTYKKLKKAFLDRVSYGPLFYNIHALLKTISVEEYLEKTDEMVQKHQAAYDAKCAEIEKMNLIIQEKNQHLVAWNERIKQLEKEVMALTRWDEYVEFEGTKYGFPYETWNSVHRKNDCMGTVFSKFEYCGCHRCEDWGGCGRSGTTTETCSICGVINSRDEWGRTHMGMY
jgi:hypothetical protein